ncbi:hypothetical protein F2Q68_00025558 [Brassica cretica]|uniref:Uncharacterized protein n=1 Tax=Brassica cretica TaxID=69181 RepID=A0A8S9ICS2_BRACR|nr:hypothetical protein F2Q68_00025558 [Brassica cretica]
MSRSLRCDRPSLSVDRYVATDPQRVSLYVATDPASRSVATDLQRVVRYIATDPASCDRSATSRSLRSDQPSLSVGRYVATDQSLTQSLRRNQAVSDIDLLVRPKSVHSRLFLNVSSHVSQSYHFSLPSIGVII